MKTLKALWNDEAGVIISTELILVVTICGIGVIVGLTTLRNDVVTELADTAEAVGEIDQSFYYVPVTGHGSSTAGSAFTDFNDFCDDPGGGRQRNEQCVVIANVRRTANGPD